MKIATWNIERPTKTTKRLLTIAECLQKLDADILILTETNEAVNLGTHYNCLHTEILRESFYKEGERRTSIYSKFPFGKFYQTFRSDTSLCVEVKTALGNLIIYGTVIGINGNKRNNFIEDLDNQVKDFEAIAPNENFCIAGDLNMSFSDNYYFTKEGREKLNNAFDKSNLLNVTSNIPQNIDNIVLSKSFIANKQIKTAIWNTNKKNSDHIGVCITLT